MNIYEYIENSQLSYPFMSDSFLNTTVDNPTSTAEFQELLKNYIYENFGIYQISPLIVMRENSTEKSFDDIISEISTLVYKANEYRYNTLYSTIIQDYNPIENYKMVENITINYKGSEKSVNNFLGKEKNSVEYTGKEKNLTNYLGNEVISDTKSGSESDTLTKSGSESNTLTKSGSENVNESATRGDITTTSKKAPFDSETFYNESQDLTSQSNEDVTNTTTTFTDRADSNTTTFTNRADTNTTTFTNRTDTNTTNYNNVKNDINKSFNERKDENIKEFENRNDTSVKEYENRTDENIKTFTDREDVTTHTRSGNIGVTTSQQMLESERMIANFKFVDIVARDIVKKIAILLY